MFSARSHRCFTLTASQHYHLYVNLHIKTDVKSAHYHDDEVHIRALLEGSGLQPKGGMALAAATVRGLILTVSHQEQIGELYPKVLETLVRGACKELF